jgi:hypothetical protein
MFADSARTKGSQKPQKGKLDGRMMTALRQTHLLGFSTSAVRSFSPKSKRRWGAAA